jgi:imidazoleglycerol-phosphate dehydratase
MREYSLNRETSESKISVKINLDEYNKANINTPISFFNHMLELFAFHSGYSIEITAESHDKDPHHVIEDVAITLGKCFNMALGDKQGINRYGWFILPMDEALVLSSVDISGRPFSSLELDIDVPMINDMPVELVDHFFKSFTDNSLTCIHIQQLNGYDSHHIVEAAFKSVARSLAMATKKSDVYINRTPSSKGVI